MESEPPGWEAQVANVTIASARMAPRSSNFGAGAILCKLGNATAVSQARLRFHGFAYRNSVRPCGTEKCLEDSADPTEVGEAECRSTRPLCAHVGGLLRPSRRICRKRGHIEVVEFETTGFWTVVASFTAAFPANCARHCLRALVDGAPLLRHAKNARFVIAR